MLLGASPKIQRIKTPTDVIARRALDQDASIAARAAMATAHKHPHPAPAPPPPTAHTLRPHHLQLLGVLFTLSSGDWATELPSPFLLHAYRVLIVEISECRQPASFAQLIAKLRDGALATDSGIQSFLEVVEHWPQSMVTPETLGIFIHAISKTMVERVDDDGTRFARRSLFGYFVRRCIVSCSKLSFEATRNLWHEFQMWSTGHLDDNAYHVRKDLISHTYNIYKTDADKKEYARAEDYAQWEAALAVGDGTLAPEHLRRFFEQRFHDQNDSRVHPSILPSLYSSSVLGDCGNMPS